MVDIDGVRNSPEEDCPGRGEQLWDQATGTGLSSQVGWAAFLPTGDLVLGSGSPFTP